MSAKSKLAARPLNLWDDYFLHHVEPLKQSGFYRVTKPLKVFKAAFYMPFEAALARAIVSMIIPVGAKVYVSPGQMQPKLARKSLDVHRKKLQGYSHAKLRASRAKVVSVNELSGKKRDWAFSSYDRGFRYEAGTTVKPIRPFSRNEVVCGSGIHFFLTLGEAKTYI